MRRILFGLIASTVLMFALACESQEFVSAKMYLQQDNLELAEEWFLKAMALETEASNAEIPFVLATQVYAEQRRYEDMSAMLEEALARNADQKIGNFTIRELVLNTRQVQWQTNYKRGASIYNKVLEEAQGQPLTDEQRTDVEEAKKFFELAVIIWPDEGVTYPNLVYCFRQLGDKEGEVKALKTALEMDPENGTIQMLAGEQEANSGNLDGAIEYFKKAYELSPDNMPIMQRLTAAYLEQGNSVAALAILEKTQKLAPGDPNISFNIGAVYENIGNSALRLGQDLYRDALSKESVPITVLEEALEHFKQAQNAYSEALYFLDNTVALNPEDLTAAQALSTIQSRKKILDTIQRSAEDILRESR